MKVTGIILAAGKGTRMKSESPKCAFPVCGIPMVALVGRAMKAAGVERPIVVIGHGGDEIEKLLGDGYEFVWQYDQRGTGHAVMQCAKILEGFEGLVLIGAGDTPLVEANIFEELKIAQEGSGADATIATAVVDDPAGYGRIVRRPDGGFQSIVEHRDADATQLAIHEVNAAIYSIDCRSLLDYLPRLKDGNAQGEFYLTDLFSEMAGDNLKVIPVQFSDSSILFGVNDRWQLASASEQMNRRTLMRLAHSGVTIVDPGTTFIGPDVAIGRDSVIEPMTILEGQTQIGVKCRIGPSSRVLNSAIGDRVQILMSTADRVAIGSDVWVGPYAHLRPHTSLADGVKVGNYVELKNAEMGPGAKANHLSYIGDATVGPGSNIGAGTITCNYDGFDKHRTTIGEDVFVGSNSTLVAPLTIEDGAMIAAGSTINQHVPADAAAFGRARQETKPGWAARFRRKKRGDA